MLLLLLLTLLLLLLRPLLPIPLLLLRLPQQFASLLKYAHLGLCRLSAVGGLSRVLLG
jgi:hypothetical protein